MEFIDGETLEAFVRRRGRCRRRWRCRSRSRSRARCAPRRAWDWSTATSSRPTSCSCARMTSESDGDEGDEIARQGHRLRPRQGGAQGRLGGVGDDHGGGLRRHAAFRQPGAVGGKRPRRALGHLQPRGNALVHARPGEPPFGGSMVQIMSQHLTRPPPSSSWSTCLRQWCVCWSTCWKKTRPSVRKPRRTCAGRSRR